MNAEMNKNEDERLAGRSSSEQIKKPSGVPGLTLDKMQKK